MKSDLAEESLADRIYYATDGTIAHVMTLIRKGATLAIEQDLDRIDLLRKYLIDRLTSTISRIIY